MGDVFSSNPHGAGPKNRPFDWAYEKISEALGNGDWISTGDCYQATKRKVKRETIHSVLMTMLDEQKITMRIIEVTGGRPCTEFKLKVPNG